jgi:hypothetical protein
MCDQPPVLETHGKLHLHEPRVEGVGSANPNPNPIAIEMLDKSRAKRLLNSFYPQAIIMLNN